MKGKKHIHHKRESSKEHDKTLSPADRFIEKEKKNRLEIVLKCDSFGTVEALTSMLSTLQTGQVEINMIHTGVGSVTSSDLFITLTGSKLVIGFNVDVLPKTEHLIYEKGIEVRLYNVIYKLADDLQKITKDLIPKEPIEKVTGEARVIDLFKSSRKGIILGCEVRRGVITLGKKFRIISAMGIIYKGKISSLHIEKDTVRVAKAGQRVGLKIADFKDVKKGDLIECYEIVPQHARRAWKPERGILSSRHVVPLNTS